ncbi:hypothetical protein WOLCODRAFT_148811 [Wolfiporia cocos MD-104 SS10]|uniref:Uncharacterized protein n=1 Tax=Wolfiporia cocos (strain MD-104) TaxID=742152 RepID=A0A2H3J7E0_WOLCO|nr:hypothetical protein WOLCODRAFT_148811 [Wolfiporia cocos MD-104 SS10]
MCEGAAGARGPAVLVPHLRVRPRETVLCCCTSPPPACTSSAPACTSPTPACTPRPPARTPRVLARWRPQRPQHASRRGSKSNMAGVAANGGLRCACHRRVASVTSRSSHHSFPRVTVTARGRAGPTAASQPGTQQRAGEIAQSYQMSPRMRRHEAAFAAHTSTSSASAPELAIPGATIAACPIPSQHTHTRATDASAFPPRHRARRRVPLRSTRRDARPRIASQAGARPRTQRPVHHSTLHSWSLSPARSRGRVRARRIHSRPIPFGARPGTPELPRVPGWPRRQICRPGFAAEDAARPGSTSAWSADAVQDIDVAYDIKRGVSKVGPRTPSGNTASTSATRPRVALLSTRICRNRDSAGRRNSDQSLIPGPHHPPCITVPGQDQVMRPQTPAASPGSESSYATERV